jgi:hypothetical protein
MVSLRFWELDCRCRRRPYCQAATAAAAWVMRTYPGRVFSIKVRRPQSTAARCWNVAQNVLFPIVVFTPIVLKLTGVISWSWWWVLSPLWIGGLLLALVVLAVCALVLGSRRHTRKQARRWADQLDSEWFRHFVAGKADPAASSGDPGLQDGEGDRG